MIRENKHSHRTPEKHEFIILNGQVSRDHHDIYRPSLVLLQVCMPQWRLNVFNIKENDWLIIPKPNNKMTIFGWTSATFANLSRRGDRFSKIPSLFDWTGRCSDHNAASWFALQQCFDVGKIFWNIQTAVKSAILLGMKFWHCTIGDEVVHIIIDVSGWRRRDPQGSGKYFETLPAQN